MEKIIIRNLLYIFSSIIICVNAFLKQDLLVVSFLYYLFIFLIFLNRLTKNINIEEEVILAKFDILLFGIFGWISAIILPNYKVENFKEVFVLFISITFLAILKYYFLYLKKK